MKSNPFGELYGKTLPAALALAGVLVGLWMYVVGGWMAAGMVGLGVAALVCLFIGRARMSTNPKSSRWLIEAWVFSPLVVAAVVTALSIVALLRLDLGAFLTAKLEAPGVDPKKIDEVAHMLNGAVSGFFAIVLTKDIWKGIGPFSVATQFESATREASKAFNDAEGEDAHERDRLIDALMNEVAPHDNIHGWGFAARGARADVIAKLKSKADRLDPDG